MLKAERLAILFRRRQFCGVASARTTTDEWRVQADVASRVYRKRLELFSFDGAKSVEHQLDDAVVAQRRQRDQLGSGGHDDPEGWMLDDVHCRYGDLYEV